MQYALETCRDPEELARFEAAHGSKRGPAEVARRVAADPEGTFLARGPDGRVLGCGSVIVHRDAGQGAYAWVGGMMVDESARRHGIARALLREGLARAEREGARTIALAASEMGRPLYLSEGFRDVAVSARWERAGEPRLPEGGARRVSIYPISSCEIMDLLRYDAPRFGASRAPFISAAMAAFPERSFVAFDRASGEIAGYCCTQERVTGPLVADHDEAAARLLHAAALSGAPPRVVASGVNPDAERLLASVGYAPDGTTCALMVKGPALPGRPQAIYGLGAWAVG